MCIREHRDREAAGFQGSSSPDRRRGPAAAASPQAWVRMHNAGRVTHTRQPPDDSGTLARELKAESERSRELDASVADAVGKLGPVSR